MERRGDLAPKVSLNRFDLGEQACRLAVQTKHVHFPVHTFGDGHNRFIDGAAGEGKLSLEAAEEFQRHGLDGRHSGNV